MRRVPIVLSVALLMLVSACGVETPGTVHPVTTLELPPKAFLFSQSSFEEVEGSSESWFWKQKSGNTLHADVFEEVAPDEELTVNRGETLFLSFTRRDAPRRIRISSYYADASAEFPSIRIRAANPTSFSANLEPGVQTVLMSSTWPQGDAPHVFRLRVE